MLIELLPQIDRMTEIGRLMNRGSAVMTRYARPYISLMRATGALPPCGCGKPRFHGGTCPARFRPSEDRLAVRRRATDMLVEGLTYPEVGKAIGISQSAASKYMKLLTPDQHRVRHDAQAARFSAGLRIRKGHPSHFSADQRQMLMDLLPRCESLRLIAKIIGSSQPTVNKIARPIVDRMQADGLLPPCGCGKPRFHLYSCETRTSTSPGLRSSERFDEIFPLMIEGITYAEIGRRLGLDRSTVRYFVRYLSADQVAVRAEAMSHYRAKALERRIAARTRRKAVSAPSVTRPVTDGLWAQIAALMPGWLAPHLRDDAISDAYIAVLEGKILQSDLSATIAKKFASTTTRQLANKFGPRSLDEALNDDTNMTLGDLIVDPGALEAFDYIFEDSFE